MPFSNAHGNAVLAAQTTQWVQLHSDDPGADCTNNIIAAGRSTGTFASAGTKDQDNTTDIVFNSVPAGTVRWFSCWSAETAGTPYWYDALTTEFTAQAGQTLTFKIGDLHNTLQ